MEVYRDAARNICIELPNEEVNFITNREPMPRGQVLKRYQGQSHERFSPLKDTLVELFTEAGEQAARGEMTMPERTPPVYLPGGAHFKEVVIRP